MASARPDWRPSQRTIQEEHDRGLTKPVHSKILEQYLKGLSLEEMLARLDDEEQEVVNY